jgi:hypothetical protein
MKLATEIDSKPHVTAKVQALLLLLAVAPVIGNAQIIWSGDFETGNFMEYHTQGDPNLVSFFQMPAYARPIDYPGQNPLGPEHVGTGELLQLVSNVSRTVDGVEYPAGPTRSGNFAARFVVKNSESASGTGVEPTDCDNGDCTRRRTVLTVQQTLPKIYNALPYMSERWLSASVFIPADWEEKQTGWGPNIFMVKPLTESGRGVTGLLDISISGSSWSVEHRWSPVQDPDIDDVPWQQQMTYTNDYRLGDGPYPRSDSWAQGLEDYPNVQASQAALGDLNKGGWTDWVIHVKFDARGSQEGGTGFLDIWKRAGSEPWVHVLHIEPKVITRDYTFDRGIGYNSPAGSDHNGGFGIKVGMYMDKSDVWDNSRPRVLFMDNIKVGDETASFSQMSPDGSSPNLDGSSPNLDAASRPNPPKLLSAP